ncbi:MAG: helix-turn-helix transcriptional regulator [Myxococcales bacterium]|nr:helix-turn-helix transcriptional regulator [Myxococcales bacterium]
MHHQQAIGERLRASRESRKLSQDDLAAKTGMTKAAIYEIEAGKRAADVDHRAPRKSARLSGGLAGVRGLKECLAECQRTVHPVVCADRARDSSAPVGAKVSSGLLACCPVAHAPAKQPTPPPPARSPIARDAASPSLPRQHPSWRR